MSRGNTEARCDPVVQHAEVQDRRAMHLLRAGVRQDGYICRAGGIGGQGEFASRLWNLIASGRSAQAEVVRAFSLVGVGYWNSVRLGMLTARRNVAKAERAREDRYFVRYFQHTTATADSEVVRLDRLEEVACGSMSPMLRVIINGNWSNLSTELHSHLTSEASTPKAVSVSKLAHSIKGLAGIETDKGWVMWSDKPLLFKNNMSYAVGTDAARGAGRQRSIRHTTMLLHALGDFALDADSPDNMSILVDELMQTHAEVEAEPPTQSAEHGNSGEAAAEPAAHLTTANANASAAAAAEPAA